MKIKHVLALAFLSTSAIACAVDADGNAADSDVAVERQALTTPTTAAIGQSFDSISDRVLPSSCLQNMQTGEVGSESASLSLGYTTSQTKVASALGVTVDGSYGAVSAEASFVREMTSDATSMSFVFGGSVSVKDLQVTGGTPDAAVASKGLLAWYQQCGDMYVQKIHRGASLYTMVKVSFVDRTEKDTFSAKVQVKAGFTLSAGFSSITQTASSSASIQVSAIQVGGDPKALATAVAGATGCTKADMGKCNDFMARIASYQTSTFPKQLTADRMAVVGYDYATWAPKYAPTLDGYPEAQELVTAFQHQYATRNTINAINGTPELPNRSEAMRATQREVLDADGGIVNGNVASLMTAWKDCYGTGASPQPNAACKATLATAKASLKPVDEAHLGRWFDAMNPTWTSYAASPYDRVDLLRDGSTFSCVATSGPRAHCTRAIGRGIGKDAQGFAKLGFAEKEELIVNLDGSFDPIHAYVWLSLRANDLAACSIGSHTTFYCSLTNGAGEPAGAASFERLSNGTIKVASIHGGNVAGVDGGAVFRSFQAAIKTRYGFDWSGLI